MSPGETIARSVTFACSLGFLPVTFHFNLFPIIVKLDKAVSVAEVVEAVEKDETVTSKLNIPLADDTLFIMAGMGFLDMENDKYKANDLTRHFVTFPSSLHGALHFSIEGLLGAAFIYPKLKSTNFAYPFKENSTPFQYAYEKMGKADLAKKHHFAIMHEEGRLESFNYFMEGKFGISKKMPDRVRGLGYDLDSVMRKEDIVIVDIGGGNGQLLRELKESYPHLTSKNLILEEFNADVHPYSEITAINWDAKGPTPQPIAGADIYNLSHIFHNTPDIESILLLKKISAAMKPHSRIFIQEMSKLLKYANMHASMIAFMGGRERSSKEWFDIAEIAGLKVTFEAYAEVREGLIEMMKI